MAAGIAIIALSIIALLCTMLIAIIYWPVPERILMPFLFSELIAMGIGISIEPSLK